MNRHYVTILSFIIASSSFLFSCSSKMKNERQLTFDSIRINRVEHLFGDSAKPACNLIVNLAYPSSADNTILKDTLTKSILAFCLGEDYADMTPQKAVKNYSDNYVRNYRQELEPSFKKEMEVAVHDLYNYYKALRGRVHFFNGLLLTYQIDSNEYTGGAHNTCYSNIENYDLTKMRQLKLNDLFKPNFQSELTAIILKQLMNNVGVSTKEELQGKGYNTLNNLSPTDNFYLDKKGITFFYNVYEVAPCVAGPVIVMIPYSALQNIINIQELQSIGLQ